jgi:hypothetical protein
MVFPFSLMLATTVHEKQRGHGIPLGRADYCNTLAAWKLIVLFVEMLNFFLILKFKNSFEGK